MRPYAIRQPTPDDAAQPDKGASPQKAPLSQKGVGGINPYTYIYTYAYTYTPNRTAASLMFCAERRWGAGVLAGMQGGFPKEWGVNPSNPPFAKGGFLGACAAARFRGNGRVS